MHSSPFIIEPLQKELYNSAILFLENIFHEEQNIPKELIPLKSIHQKWWCIRNNNEIVGTVAAWEINSEWHWGRLAIHEKTRGHGLGSKLVVKSLEELFQSGIEVIKIDARDIIVKMLLQVGGKITGDTTEFYGIPITPMEICREDFIRIVR